MRTPPVDLLCHVMYQYLYFHVSNSLHCLQCLPRPQDPYVKGCKQDLVTPIRLSSQSIPRRSKSRMNVWFGGYILVVLTCLLVWANFGGHAFMICAHDLTRTLGDNLGRYFGTTRLMPVILLDLSAYGTVTDQKHQPKLQTYACNRGLLFFERFLKISLRTLLPRWNS